MARTRNIKPQFFKHPEMNDLSLAARYLFIGLLTQADRNGILQDKPRLIKAEVFPYEDVDVDELLGELNGAGFVLRYKHGNDAYVQIKNFRKHQNPHPKEKDSGWPQPHELLSETALPCNLIESNVISPFPSLSNPSTPSLPNPSEAEEAATLPASEYAFNGMYFKLKHADLNRWANSFRTLDVLNECKRMDEWYGKQVATEKMMPDEIRRKWFWQVAQALAKEDMKRKTEMGGASL